MIVLVLGLWTFLRALVVGAAAVSIENLAPRSQLAVLQRSVPRPKVYRRDRLFWVWLSRLWTGWQSTLVIVQPATVLAWHRRGFQLRRTSSNRSGTSQPHPPHGQREPHLGSASDSSRTPLPRLRGGRAYDREVHAPTITAALPHLARLPGYA